MSENFFLLLCWHDIVFYILMAQILTGFFKHSFPVYKYIYEPVEENFLWQAIVVLWTSCVCVRTFPEILAFFYHNTNTFSNTINDILWSFSVCLMIRFALIFCYIYWYMCCVDWICCLSYICVIFFDFEARKSSISVFFFFASGSFIDSSCRELWIEITSPCMPPTLLSSTIYF